jgi:formylglycine-generating enzyme
MKLPQRLKSVLWWVFCGLVFWWLCWGIAWSAPEQMVRIAGGSFLPLYNVAPARGKLAKGATRAGTPVQVAPFYLDRYPVTNQQFLEFVRANPKWRRSKVKRLFAERGYLKHWKSDTSFDDSLASSPVVNVSWFAARAYCKAHSKRLPTQQEWEFVAQASQNETNGSRDPQFRKQVLDWYGKPTPDRLPSVGKAFRNVYGVYDLYGLTWEWVDDFNTLLGTGESRGDGNLERDLYCAGGSVGSVDPSDYAAYMRYAFRSSLKANYSVPNLSFRAASSRKQ